jgi:integrase/recombinase XerC
VFVVPKNNYKKETENKINDKITEMLQNAPDFVYSYIMSIFHSTSASTRLEYLRDIMLFLSYIVESVDYKIDGVKNVTLDIIDSLDADFLNSYANYLSLYRANGEQRSNENVSIRRKLSSIRSLYSYLYLNDKIKANPMLKVKVPKVPKKEIIRMDKGETGEFLNTVKNGNEKSSNMQAKYHEKQKERDFALISLFLGTGIRVSELVGLDITDIDTKHYAVKVVRKGGKEEIVYMSDTLTEIMEDYLEYRKTLNPLPGHENALFLSSQRKRIGVRSVEILVKKYAEQTALLKHITPHKLRSTFGTALYENTGDLYLVAEVLGHSSVETTRKHYANISNQHKFENRNKI